MTVTLYYHASCHMFCCLYSGGQPSTTGISEPLHTGNNGPPPPTAPPETMVEVVEGYEGTTFKSGRHLGFFDCIVITCMNDNDYIQWFQIS